MSGKLWFCFIGSSAVMVAMIVPLFLSIRPIPFLPHYSAQPWLSILGVAALVAIVSAAAILWKARTQETDNG